jgi:hypothetical protein
MSKSLVLLTGLVLATLLTSPAAIAQSNNGDSRDPFARAASGDTTGVLQLIQGLQNGKQRNSDEVATEQQQQISGAAARFRAEQARRAQSPQQKPSQQPSVKK